MNKILIGLIFSLGLFMPQAHATAAVTPPVFLGAADGLPNFWMFSGAVAAGTMVMFLNAENISFPFCGQNWLNEKNARGFTGAKCYDQYPNDYQYQK